MPILGLIGGLLQKKPKVPKFVETQLPVEQQKAIAANLAALGPSEELASRVNEFSQEQLMKALRTAIPGYDQLTGKAAGVIQSQLSGEIPADVQAAIGRSSAARALGGGFAGSGAARNLTARDLGLTSLQLTQQGLDSASRWITMARANAVAPQMDVTSMFITPQQQYQVTSEQRAAQFQRQFAANQLSAQYDPATIAGQSLQLTEAQLMQMGSSVLGGMAYSGRLFGGGAQPAAPNYFPPPGPPGLYAPLSPIMT